MADKDSKAWSSVGWLGARREASVKATKKARAKMLRDHRLRSTAHGHLGSSSVVVLLNINLPGHITTLTTAA